MRKLLNREIELLKFSGARVVRIIDGVNAHVGEHAHDWPVLSIFVLGTYENRSTVGERSISSPSAVFYRAGEAHENRVGRYGYEQLQIEFDPKWLRSVDTTAFAPARHWIGGRVAAAARALASTCSSRDATESTIADATGELLRLAIGVGEMKRPVWLNRVVESLKSETVPTTDDLARELGMHAGWLAEAYRAATGEGIHETVRRRRVEMASGLLRHSDHSAADIASAAGFCDQSHMIRSVRSILGRTPTQIRAEWNHLNQRPGAGGAGRQSSGSSGS
jgi:AraC family transcriptional regulator